MAASGRSRKRREFPDSATEDDLKVLYHPPKAMKMVWEVTNIMAARCKNALLGTERLQVPSQTESQEPLSPAEGEVLEYQVVWRDAEWRDKPSWIPATDVGTPLIKAWHHLLRTRPHLDNFTLEGNGYCAAPF